MKGWQFFFYVLGIVAFNSIIGAGIVLVLHAVFGL